MASEAPVPDEPDDVMKLIGRAVAELSTGDRARLRRMYLTGSHQADGVVIGLLHDAGVRVPTDREGFAPWKLLAHVAALLSGTGAKGGNPHAPGRQLGNALCEAGFSENRLLRLTATRGKLLHDQIIRAARTLAQAKTADARERIVKGVDLWAVFRLAGGTAEQAEQARFKVAKHYYAAARQKGE